MYEMNEGARRANEDMARRSLQASQDTTVALLRDIKKLLILQLLLGNTSMEAIADALGTTIKHISELVDLPPA